MTESKPTPGPWSAYGENICAKLASDTRTEIIATTCGFQGLIKDLDNARLIASAPELLAALETITADSRIARLHSDHQAMITSAIAKAKGTK
jgi:hypothetical protein